MRTHRQRCLLGLFLRRRNRNDETDCIFDLRIVAPGREHGRSAAATLVEQSDLHPAGRGGADDVHGLSARVRGARDECSCGSGRSSETKGSIAALAGSHTAMTMPSGIATAPASMKPSSTRCVDIQMSVSSCPLAKLATASATTRPGLGRKTGDTHPRSVDRYQSASTNSTDTALISSRTGLRLFRLPAGGVSAVVPSAERTAGVRSLLAICDTYSHFRSV